MPESDATININIRQEADITINGIRFFIQPCSINGRRYLRMVPAEGNNMVVPEGEAVSLPGTNVLGVIVL